MHGSADQLVFRRLCADRADLVWCDGENRRGRSRSGGRRFDDRRPDDRRYDDRRPDDRRYDDRRPDDRRYDDRRPDDRRFDDRRPDDRRFDDRRPDDRRPDDRRPERFDDRRRAAAAAGCARPLSHAHTLAAAARARRWPGVLEGVGLRAAHSRGTGTVVAWPRA